MTPTDINRRLALAIGYVPEDVEIRADSIIFVARNAEWFGSSPIRYWKAFDYREARTIYPIAEKYRLMPIWDSLNRGWYVPPAIVQKALHDCPRACVALATIEAHDRGLI